ncbi:phosphoglucosamine mutase [Aerosakkonemataceae cyanobacterium BLCC-F154]|uniref:Phosphoglucosamine mutase n=1 Tax=Floridaenema fluviatile BLCC-F154 TaxID=3153640 RepID=A0ABV4Y5D8_9CYAN
MVSTPVKTQSSGRSELGISVVPTVSSPQANPNPGYHSTALPSTALFGTDGIRGKVGDLLTAELALQVGFHCGQVLSSIFSHQASSTGKVIVGQDTRNSSNMLAMALSAGLTAAGLEVWDLGICPTPGVAYLTHAAGALGGVMISASHNPPEDNGIKIFGPSGTKLNKELQAEIEAGLRGKREFSNITGNGWGKHYQRRDLLKDYKASLTEPLQAGLDLRGMRVVLDLAWGAAVGIAPEVFAAMGAEVICLHEAADGDRINVNCGSTHLGKLQEAVKVHQADLGFAFDGDADRALAVDSQGRVVDGDYILYFWGQHLAQGQKLPGNMIVATVMANLGFELAWQHLGGQFLRTPVGDQYVHAEMVRQDAMLGGEQSGHILCRHYGISGDGLLTALHLAAIVKETGTSLREMVDQSFQPYPQVLKNVRVEDREVRLNWQNCDVLMNAIAQAENAMAGQGRILVRASGTEPLIRVMVEAASAELTHHWADKLVLTVQQHLVA